MDRPESRFEAFRRRKQDAMLPVKSWEDDLGGVSAADSPYYAEDRRYGKDEHQTRELLRTVVNPIIDECAKRGVSLADLDMYLAAKHAPNRNALIAFRTKDKNLAGSGMADLTAGAILDAFARKGKTANLDAVAQMVWRMNRRTLARLVLAGLMPRKQAVSWRRLSPHYVPLRSHLENEDFNADGVSAAITKLESKHALGRSTLADSPIIFSILQAEQAIVRANKNEVRQKVAELVKAHPETGRILNGKPMRRTLNESTGRVTWATDHNFREKNSEKGPGEANVIQFKEGGRLKYIVLNGERGKLIARAITKYGMADMDGKFWETSMRVNRFLANTRTSWSLPFLLRNLGYDTQQVAITMNMDGMHKASLLYAKNILTGSAIRAAHDYLKHGTYNGSLGHYMKEYVENGGLIKGGTSQGFDETSDYLLKNIRGGQTMAGRAKNKFLDKLERANASIEMQTRFAVYAALRDSGWTPEEAVSYARDVTVNFNRKGEQGQRINNLWMFANASIQDMERIARSVVGSGRGVHNGERSSLASRGATLSALVALGVLAALGGGDDDDGEMENMTEYSKQTSWHRRWFKSPYYVRIGRRGPYNLVPYVAQKLTEITLGKTKAGDAAADISEFMFSLAFDPVNGQIMHGDNGRGIDLLDTLVNMAPTEPGKLLAQMATDRTFTGEPLTRKRWNENLPASHNGKERTSSAAKQAAQTINALTGGDQYTTGAIDLPPEYIELVVSTIFGSLGSDTMRTIGTAQDIANGELNPERIPVLRDIMRKIPDNTQRYYEAMSRQKGYETSVKGHRADRDWAKVREFEAKHPSARQETAARLREKAKQIKTLRDQETRLTGPAAERTRQRRTKLQGEYIKLLGD